MTVLVVADRNDWPTDRVVKNLTERGVEVFRIDTADFPQELTMATRIDQPHPWQGQLRTAHRSATLGEVTAVYYRAPNSFQFPIEMTASEERFAFAQARAGFGGVLSTLPCRWVNHPAALARAEYKPVQLETARQVGLAIPPTLITNSADEVRAFAAEHPRVVVKTLGSPVVREGGELRTIYSRPLHSEDLEDLAGVETTAHLVQAWVEKCYEVRLTVVGERQFAAEIHAGSESGYADWRSDYGALRYEPTQVPVAEAAAVNRLMNALDLRYGAVDFIVGPDGEWTFLEVNPCGQWDWIQGATGQPIAEAIADELQGGDAA